MAIVLISMCGMIGSLVLAGATIVAGGAIASTIGAFFVGGFCGGLVGLSILSAKYFLCDGRHDAANLAPDVTE